MEFTSTILLNCAAGCNNRSSTRKLVKAIGHVVMPRVKTESPKSHK